MHRDMELVRQILLEIEEKPFWDVAKTTSLDIENYDERYCYHAMLLDEAGLIEAKRMNHDTHMGGA